MFVRSNWIDVVRRRRRRRREHLTQSLPSQPGSTAWPGPPHLSPNSSILITASQLIQTIERNQHYQRISPVYRLGEVRESVIPILVLVNHCSSVDLSLYRDSWEFGDLLSQ